MQLSGLCVAQYSIDTVLDGLIPVSSARHFSNKWWRISMSKNTLKSVLKSVPFGTDNKL